MAKTDKKNAPPTHKSGKRDALVELNRLGSLEDVLNSGASLEVKAACIEMEIDARSRRQHRGEQD